MSYEARQVLQEYWGYTDFRSCQEEIIDSVLAGNDTLGLMPTGGGKSITFQVPALMLPGTTLVVTPLISLMKDQVDNLWTHGIKAIALHSGLTLRENNVALNQLENRHVKILYVSPEKLQSDRFVTLLRNIEISLIVVDEAHCISQWGYDFRPSYLNIAKIRQLKPSAPILALTASATPDVVTDITDKLNFKSRDYIFKLSFSRNNISYLVRYTENKEAKMIDILSKVNGTAIVYVRSRRRTLELARTLAAAGISAEGYHAGLTPEIKADRQNNWKAGTTRVIVATNAFGMGIDKPDVRVVIHHDIPPSLEEYYQEAGRAGRDGKESFAVMLVARPDHRTLMRHLADSFPPRDYIREVYSKVCVFLNIAVGEGYETLHEFNFKLFCERFKLQPVQVHSALTILSNSGYLNYQEDYNSKSRVMIIVTKQELYNLHLSPNADKVLHTLLRSYTGLFADYEYISESVISNRASLSEQATYEALIQLSRQHVIHYIPRSNNPMMLLTASRVDGQHVIIPTAIYETRRNNMKQRIDAMEKFAFDSSECRVNTLLRYFGEESTTPCLKCDVCRARTANTRSNTDKTVRIVQTILDINSPITVNQLIYDSMCNPDIVIETLRTLADEGHIEITGDIVKKL